MPAGSSSRTDAAPQNGGNYRIRVFVYQPAKGVDDQGGVIRDPAGIGLAAGGAKPTATPVWIDRVSIDAYLPKRANDGSSPVESWATLIETRWAKNKQYVAGMFLWIPGTGEAYTVASVENLFERFAKVQLTCTRVT